MTKTTRVHDLGGRPCQDVTIPQHQAYQPVFEVVWQARTLAITLAVGLRGKWTIDVSRYARESLPAVDYLSLSYYEIWIAALTNLLVEFELVEAIELSTLENTLMANDVKLGINPEQAIASLSSCIPYSRPFEQLPKFNKSQKVRTRFPHDN